MQISALPTATISRLNSGETATPVATPRNTSLGQHDFLKLLAKQFQTQDPMKPMEDTSFIAQMAQFTSLEQTSAMSSNITKLLADQNSATANSYLGRSVTVDLGLGDGTVGTGNVTAIDATSGAPELVIGGKNYPLSSVLRVEPGVPSTNPAPVASRTP